MNPSCVLVLIFSHLLISLAFGERELETEKNPGCEGVSCENIDLMYSTSVDPQSNQSLFFISSIRRDKIKNFGLLITQAGNLSIQYSKIFQDECKGVFSYKKPEPKDSIGLIFESLPLSVEEPKWAESTSECDDHNGKCLLEFTGTGANEELIKIEAQITSDFHIYPDFPAFELSPKTLHLQISLTNIEASILQTKNLTMLIAEPDEKYLIYSPKIGLVTFGSTSDHTGDTFKMIADSAEFAEWKLEATETGGTSIPVTTTNPTRVPVDLKKYNLPVACFFEDQKSFKVHEVTVTFDAAKISGLVNVTWPMIIGLGGDLRPSPASSATSHALRNWLIVGGICIVLALVGAFLYIKGKKRN
ncbi:uncharacterized protein LOC141849310 [Brevipalpus obovatus]|uniref:uncharacterized protein LOC141849310 n=1 Tax=Brevipalpus obovatus TaxID=246614 RepID=UPI003D9F0FD5